MFLRPLVLILFALALASPAHAESAPGIKVPEIPPLPRAANLKIEEYKLFRAMADGAAATLIPELHFKDPIATPQAGETTSYGVAVGADLAAAFAAQMRGDAPAALTALDAAEAAAAGDSRTLFEIAMLRTQIHITTGQSDAAEAELARAEQFEIETFNTNVNSRALLGEARLWAGDFKHAINYLAQVAVATRDWRLPTEYATVPENLGEVFNMTTAQLRSYSSLAAAYMLLEDFEQALVWARRAEAAAADIFSVTTHPFYRLVVPFHADGYYGRALNLAVLGAVLLIVKDDRAGAKRAFASVHALLDAAGLATPKISADALHAQALLQAGLLDEAELIAGRAAAEANRRGLPDLVWRIEALQGEALLADGRAEEAEAAFERAQAAIELVSGALATDRAKRRFGIGKDDVTTRLVDFAIAKGDLAKAFDILERGRARAFVDMLADRTVAAGREAELSEQIRGIDGELRNLRFLAGSPAGAAEDFLDQQSDLTAKRDELAAELRARDPELADVLSVSHSEVGDIQAALTPGDVLAYGLPARGDALVRILLITRDAIRIEQLGASDSGFAKVLKAFRLAVEESADAGRQQKMTDGLGRLLNVAAWGARRTLYVVPSGQLFFIPWGALAIDAPVAVLPTGATGARPARPTPWWSAIRNFSTRCHSFPAPGARRSASARPMASSPCSARRRPRRNCAARSAAAFAFSTSPPMPSFMPPARCNPRLF